MSKKDTTKGFIQGIGYVIGLLERDLKFECEAEQVLHECNYDVEDFENADVTEYDLNEIKKVAKRNKKGAD